MNVCDKSGRCFEYVVVYTICKEMLNCTLTTRTIESQRRDCPYYDNMQGTKKVNYKNAAEVAAKWLTDSFPQIKNGHSIIVDRLSDQDARKGDVTDICISDSNNNLIANLSLKHCHHALKHQRPSNTPNQCGYEKKSPIAMQFKSGYSSITDEFHEHRAGIDRFCDLEDGVVSDYLYRPMCKHVADFINTSCNNPYYANSLFTFLVGNKNFYKLVYEEHLNQLHITHFDGSHNITSVVATPRNNSYIDLLFSNNWDISMRLHTATTGIKPKPDLKFDTQLINCHDDLSTLIVKV